MADMWVTLEHVNEIEEPLFIFLHFHMVREDLLKLDECVFIGLTHESVPLI